MQTKLSSKNLTGRDHLKDQGADGRILLKRIIKKMRVWERGLDSVSSGYSTVLGSCEQGNEHLGPIKSGAFFNQLNGHQILKEDSAPCSQLHEQEAQVYW